MLAMQVSILNAICPRPTISEYSDAFKVCLDVAQRFEHYSRLYPDNPLVNQIEKKLLLIGIYEHPHYQPRWRPHPDDPLDSIQY
jgi:hypothetical protein